MIIVGVDGQQLPLSFQLPDQGHGLVVPDHIFPQRFCRPRILPVKEQRRTVKLLQIRFLLHRVGGQDHDFVRPLLQGLLHRDQVGNAAIQVRNVAHQMRRTRRRQAAGGFQYLQTMFFQHPFCEVGRIPREGIGRHNRQTAVGIQSFGQLFGIIVDSVKIHIGSLGDEVAEGKHLFARLGVQIE